jgi:hypothetical protein
VLALQLKDQSLQAQIIEETLDAVTSSTCVVAGWARDPQNTAPINIQIYRDGRSGSGVLVVAILANLLRSASVYGSGSIPI